MKGNGPMSVSVLILALTMASGCENQGGREGGVDYHSAKIIGKWLLQEMIVNSEFQHPNEVGDYNIDLDGVTVLELRIVPDISGGSAWASLAHLRVAS
jgi:hypothetical protein